MTEEQLIKELEDFAGTAKIKGKGPLSLVLQITEEVQKRGTVPETFEDILTERGGQVQGLSGARVQKILSKHGIDRQLSSEGGRTSRGSIDNAKIYIKFLADLNHKGLIDLEVIERFWVEKVIEFFSSKPLRISQDVTKSLKAVISDLLNQAIERQKEMPGTHYAGAVLQHLVGAKLEIVYGEGKVGHNSFSTSDSQKERPGDFAVENTAIHVTTAPTENLMRKCADNIRDGLRPVLITRGQRAVSTAEVLAESAGISMRLDIWDAEPFLSANLHEHGRFHDDGRREALERLIRGYNRIVETYETDPSLKIDFRKK